MTDDSRQEDGPEWAVTWGEVGRELLSGELAECRLEIEGAFREVEDALYGEMDGEGEYSGEVTPEQVRQLRLALNRARERVENQLAPVAGVKPWGDPPPRIPMGELWELTEHPNAEGVDPRDYVDDDATAPEETEQQ